MTTKHTFLALSITDDCHLCGERYAHPVHHGIALVQELPTRNGGECPATQEGPQMSGFMASIEQPAETKSAKGTLVTRVLGHRDKPSGLWLDTAYPERVFTGPDHVEQAQAYADKRTSECHDNPSMRETLALFQASLFFELKEVEVAA